MNVHREELEANSKQLGKKPASVQLKLIPSEEVAEVQTPVKKRKVTRSRLKIITPEEAANIKKEKQWNNNNPEDKTEQKEKISTLSLSKPNTENHTDKKITIRVPSSDGGISLQNIRTGKVSTSSAEANQPEIVNIVQQGSEANQPDIVNIVQGSEANQPEIVNIVQTSEANQPEIVNIVQKSEANQPEIVNIVQQTSEAIIEQATTNTQVVNMQEQSVEHEMSSIVQQLSDGTIVLQDTSESAAALALAQFSGVGNVAQDGQQTIYILTPEEGTAVMEENMDTVSYVSVTENSTS